MARKRLVFVYILNILAVGRRRLLEYVMGCSAVASVLIPLVAALGFDRSCLDPLFGWAAFANVALLYYVGGFYLAHYVDRPEGFPVPWWVSVAVYVVSTEAMALVSAASNGFVGFDAVSGAYDPYWVSIASPLCVVQAASVFCAAMALEPHLSWVGRRGLGVLARVSGASLGVYLVQMPVINWIGLRLYWPGYEWLQDTVVRAMRGAAIPRRP